MITSPIRQPNMSLISDSLSTTELMRIASDFNQQKVTLTEEEKQQLISLLKQHAQNELDYGQELECDSVRLVRRVTGAVSVFFT